jgi:hypothetical protein
MTPDPGINMAASVGPSPSTSSPRSATSSSPEQCTPLRQDRQNDKGGQSSVDLLQSGSSHRQCAATSPQQPVESGPAHELRSLAPHNRRDAPVRQVRQNGMEEQSQHHDQHQAGHLLLQGVTSSRTALAAAAVVTRNALGSLQSLFAQPDRQANRQRQVRQYDNKEHSYNDGQQTGPDRERVAASSPHPSAANNPATVRDSTSPSRLSSARSMPNASTTITSPGTSASAVREPDEVVRPQPGRLATVDDAVCAAYRHRLLASSFSTSFSTDSITLSTPTSSTPLNSSALLIGHVHDHTSTSSAVSTSLMADRRATSPALSSGSASQSTHAHSLSACSTSPTADLESTRDVCQDGRSSTASTPPTVVCSTSPSEATRCPQTGLSSKSDGPAVRCDRACVTSSTASLDGASRLYTEATMTAESARACYEPSSSAPVVPTPLQRDSPATSCDRACVTSSIASMDGASRLYSEATMTAEDVPACSEPSSPAPVVPAHSQRDGPATSCDGACVASSTASSDGASRLYSEATPRGEGAPVCPEPSSAAPLVSSLHSLGHDTESCDKNGECASSPAHQSRISTSPRPNTCRPSADSMLLMAVDPSASLEVGSIELLITETELDTAVPDKVGGHVQSSDHEPKLASIFEPELELPSSFNGETSPEPMQSRLLSPRRAVQTASKLLSIGSNLVSDVSTVLYRSVVVPASCSTRMALVLVADLMTSMSPYTLAFRTSPSRSVVSCQRLTAVVLMATLPATCGSESARVATGTSMALGIPTESLIWGVESNPSHFAPDHITDAQTDSPNHGVHVQSSSVLHLAVEPQDDDGRCLAADAQADSDHDYALRDRASSNHDQAANAQVKDEQQLSTCHCKRLQGSDGVQLFDCTLTRRRSGMFGIYSTEYLGLPWIADSTRATMAIDVVPDLLPGDLVTHVNGKGPLAHHEMLRELVASRNIVTLRVARGEELLSQMEYQSNVLGSTLRQTAVAVVKYLLKCLAWLVIGILALAIVDCSLQTYSSTSAKQTAVRDGVFGKEISRSSGGGEECSSCDKMLHVSRSASHSVSPARGCSVQVADGQAPERSEHTGLPASARQIDGSTAVSKLLITQESVRSITHAGESKVLPATFKDSFADQVLLADTGLNKDATSSCDEKRALHCSSPASVIERISAVHSRDETSVREGDRCILGGHNCSAEVPLESASAVHPDASSGDASTVDRADCVPLPLTRDRSAVDMRVVHASEHDQMLRTRRSDDEDALTEAFDLKMATSNDVPSVLC